MIQALHQDDWRTNLTRCQEANSPYFMDYSHHHYHHHLSSTTDFLQVVWLSSFLSFQHNGFFYRWFCYHHHHHHHLSIIKNFLRMIWLSKSLHCSHQGSDGIMQSIYCSCLLRVIPPIQHPPPSVHSNPDLYFRLFWCKWQIHLKKNHTF